MPRPKSTGLPKAEEEHLRLIHLLDAAADVFLELGYEAASTAEIAARAHSSKRAVYSRFASKEELFLAVIDYRTSKIADRITTIFAEDAPIEKTLTIVARALLTSLLSPEHIALMRLVYMQALQFPKAAEYWTERGPDRGIAKLSAHLKKQVRQGTLIAPDTQLAAQHFAGLLVGDLTHRAALGLEVPHSKRQQEARVQSAVAAFLKIYGNQQVP